jgi:hypothetical protein
MIRIYHNDGTDRAISIKRTSEELKILHSMTRVWPPTIDGYLFQNQQEVDAVIELRQHLHEIEDDCNWASLDVKDIRLLLCFARARKLNVKAATQMWMASYHWRKEHEPEKLSAGFVPPAVVDHYGTGGPFGHDRDGSPIFIDRLGQIDPAGILKHTDNTDDIVECEIVRSEYLQAITDLACIRDRKLHWGITIIMDLTGLGINHLNRGGLQVLKRIMHQSDSNYPERAKRVLVINAPAIFSAIWKIVQHFLDPVTREKVQIYGDGATEHLLRYIAPDQLPAFLGGTATNGLGNKECNPPIRSGGKVPKDFKEPSFEDSFETIK